MIENTYTVTRKRYTGWARVSMKRKGKKSMVLWGGATVLAALVMVYGLLSGDLIHSMLYLLITLFCIYRGFLRMWLLISKQFTVLQAIQGQKKWERTIRFEDGLMVADGKQTAKYHYNDMARLGETAQDYWIYFADGISICLDKNGFTEGSAGEFLDFMKKRKLTLEDTRDAA